MRINKLYSTVYLRVADRSSSRRAFVERNWRCPAGEVDLIVRRGRLLVVCEVKSRRNDAYGGPAAAVGRLKQQRLRRLAAEWLTTTGVHGVDVRFDVVAVTGTDVEVIEAAF